MVVYDSAGWSLKVTRKDADLKQLEKRLTKHLSKAQSELRLLSQQEFACSKDALIAAERLSHKLPLHQLISRLRR